MNELDSFLRTIDRLTVEQLLPRAARPLDERAHAAALQRAGESARAAGLDKSIEVAHRTVDDYVIGLFNRSHVQPGWWEVNWGRPGTTADRANLAQSLGEAVTSIILGDRLDEADRDELLGAWADLVGRG
jgi:hypothetical protein